MISPTSGQNKQYAFVEEPAKKETGLKGWFSKWNRERANANTVKEVQNDLNALKGKILRVKTSQEHETIASQLENIYQCCMKKRKLIEKKMDAYSPKNKISQDEYTLVTQLDALEHQAEELIWKNLKEEMVHRLASEKYPKILSRDEILARNRRKVDPKSVPRKLKKAFDEAQTQNDYVDPEFTGLWQRPSPSRQCSEKITPDTVASHPGISSTQGDRDSMEDAHVADSFEIKVNGKKQTISLFGIFDGHSGSACAKFLAANTKDYLQKELEKELAGKELGTPEANAAITNVLKVVFVNLGEEYSKTHRSIHRAGSTANIALIMGDQVWVANAGDSRSIISTKDKTIAMSLDDKPETRKRDVIKRGARVRPENEESVARVIGNDGRDIAMARAVGHDEGLSGINPRTKVVPYKLSDLPKGKNFLVIGCDGLWDVGSSNNVSKTVQENSSKSPHELAALLVDRAYGAGSGDNISVMVVALPEGQ